MSAKKLIVTSGVLFLIISATGAIGATVVRDKKSDSEKKNNTQEAVAEIRLPVGTAGVTTLNQASDSTGSWAGEIVSPSILEVHPQSEGSIVQLSVRVGQRVGAGDVIATLSPPPASIERANMAAEKKEALVRARANAEATKRVVEKTRAELHVARESLVPARDAAIEVAHKDIERNLYMNKSSEIELENMKKEKNARIELAAQELKKAEVDVGQMERELKTLVEQIVEKDLLALTTWTGSNIRSLATNWNLRLRIGVGAIDPGSKTAYESALSRIIRDIYSSASIDESAIAYVESTKRAVYASREISDEIMESMIATMKGEARENQMKVVASVKKKKESVSMLAVKKAELEKMIAERDREVGSSSIAVRQSQIDSESNEISKRKATVDNELEYQNRKREIDVRLIELDRELELANKEVEAAEASYATFLGMVSSQAVRAQRSGIVSGIYKKAGDYVMPDAVIAAVSQENADDVFVRFRIPSDTPRPEVGSEVTIIRPGFPFDRKAAVISGVGGTLGSQGVFIAEAEFTDMVSWPINALVRVLPSSGSDAALFVPFTALSWNEDGQAEVVVLHGTDPAEKRIVLTGKAVGDAVEIVEGLERGEKYLERPLSTEVMKALVTDGTDGIKGMIVDTPAPTSGEKEEGHGGGHGE